MLSNKNQMQPEVMTAIAALCRELKIPALFENLQKQLDDPTYQSLSFLRRLEEMLQAEKNSRH